MKSFLLMAKKDRQIDKDHISVVFANIYLFFFSAFCKS